MNGAQDLGGMMGFGPIEREADEPWFHAEWERRAFGVTLAVGATGSWTLDASRHARESLPPAEYLASSYYEIWTKGVEKLVVQTGLVAQAELLQGKALFPPAQVKRVLKAEDVPEVLARGGPTERPVPQPARFALGDLVVTRNIHPRTHTRLPRYARGRKGVVERVHGAHVFPDSNAHGRGENPQWLYTIRFTGRELWGDDADPALAVSIDAWESYLERHEDIARAVAATAPIPRDQDGGPVFREPWEAQAFAMVVALHERGVFTWPEWAEALSTEIRRAEAAGACGDGSDYYRHWLSAIEGIVGRKGIASEQILSERRDAWDRAAHATPHGQPILLANDPARREHGHT